MNKEIEEARAYKKRKANLTAKLAILSKGIESDGFAYIITVSDLRTPLCGICAGGPADHLSRMVTTAVKYTTNLMAKDLLRRREAMKEAGIEEDSVDLREEHERGTN